MPCSCSTCTSGSSTALFTNAELVLHVINVRLDAEHSRLAAYAATGTTTYGVGAVYSRLAAYAATGTTTYGVGAVYSRLAAYASTGITTYGVGAVYSRLAA